MATQTTVFFICRMSCRELISQILDILLQSRVPGSRQRGRGQVEGTWLSAARPWSSPGYLALDTEAVVKSRVPSSRQRGRGQVEGTWLSAPRPWSSRGYLALGRDAVFKSRVPGSRHRGRGQVEGTWLSAARPWSSRRYLALCSDGLAHVDCTILYLSIRDLNNT